MMSLQLDGWKIIQITHRPTVDHLIGTGDMSWYTTGSDLWVCPVGCATWTIRTSDHRQKGKNRRNQDKLWNLLLKYGKTNPIDNCFGSFDFPHQSIEVLVTINWGFGSTQLDGSMHTATGDQVNTSGFKQVNCWSNAARMILAECHEPLYFCHRLVDFAISYLSKMIKVRMGTLLQVEIWNPYVHQATLQWRSMAGWRLPILPVETVWESCLPQWRSATAYHPT